MSFLCTRSCVPCFGDALLVVGVGPRGQKRHLRRVLRRRSRGHVRGMFCFLSCSTYILTHFRNIRRAPSPWSGALSARKPSRLDPVRAVRTSSHLSSAFSPSELEYFHFCAFWTLIASPSLRPACVLRRKPTFAPP